MTILAVDCMGGDHGPRITLPACRQFLDTHPDAQLLLVGRPEDLQSFQHPRARLVPATGVVTMDDPEGVEAIVAVARELRPDLTIVARARDARHAQRLYDLGATDAVPETVEASLQLSEAVLVEIGVPMGLVIASIHERRDEFRKVPRAGDVRRPVDGEPAFQRRESRRSPKGDGEIRLIGKRINAPGRGS